MDSVFRSASCRASSAEFIFNANLCQTKNLIRQSSKIITVKKRQIKIWFEEFFSLITLVYCPLFSGFLLPRAYGFLMIFRYSIIYYLKGNELITQGKSEKTQILGLFLCSTIIQFDGNALATNVHWEKRWVGNIHQRAKTKIVHSFHKIGILFEKLWFFILQHK